MEVFKCSAPTNLRIRLSTSPLITAEFPTRSSKTRSHIKYTTPSSVFYKNSPFPIYFPISNTRRRFLVFSQFGRTTNRQNSLRKKLLQDQQVRQIPSPLNPNSGIQRPNPNFDNGERLGEKTDHESVKANDFSDIPKEPKSKSKSVGESVLFNKLENWVEQYRKDTEYWGIGSGPIFTVFLDPDSNVKRVSVDENEIFRRSGVEKGELGSSSGAKMKILQAKSLAREMESGKKDVIPMNSSVAKFVVDQVEESSFFKAIRSFALSPNLVQELPRVGMMLFYGFIAVWAVKKLFSFRDKEVSLTESEKEMMRRKIKSRKEKEVLEKGSVEVVQKPLELPMLSGEKLRLDKEELMRNIASAKSRDGNVASLGASIAPDAKSVEFEGKIREIRKMAREAREIEGGKNDLFKMNGGENEVMSEGGYKGTKEGKYYGEEETGLLTHVLNGDTQQIRSDKKFLLDEAFVGNGNITSRVESSDIRQSTIEDQKENSSVDYLADDASSGEPRDSRGSSSQAKPRIIRSVKEAREYLSEKRHKREGEEEPRFKTVSEIATHLNPQSDEQYDNGTGKELDMEEKVFTSAISDETLDSSPLPNASKDSAVENEEFVGIKNGNPDVLKEGDDDVPEHQGSLDHEGNDRSSEVGPSLEEETWSKKNLNEHIAKKIGVGFRDNYMVARELNNQQSNTNSSLKQLESIGDVNELEWMEDDKLAEIVFRVRENELAGRDPFYMMDSEDKHAFFEGLEKKVERENEKLSTLHEWLHSNIENLDYGADGISLYDPPEKIIPRWKGPPLEKSPEFLNNFQKQRKAIFAETTEILNHVKKDAEDLLQKSTESPPNKSSATSSAVNDLKKKLQRGKESSRTIIEGSDGSVKAGKKSGKEFWQHTKKWSRGFLESYNAETDPEVKPIMRDMGKDLDRWITEKEIQEAADLMDKLPERNKEFMEKKLKKLKREMELFGPQAVVSKYREYADNMEEDYLWWLDLPYVLCIELYTVEDGEQRIGFYSLEMATDLELEPKPHHVISFEDANDCKNLCCIIQAQMEMLGNGHAFVVAQPPKDAFREAKENGFNVTVISKGELQLNVDQTLEEVEEQIKEIGSKMYHDMIMRERSVDISSLMKGVFGFKSKPTRTKRKRSKKMLKKREKK
ncbi:hypothetical protein TIFTF001_012111 [Ficus carica]|uniref:Embryo defective 1703 n=1 Tax=Ficus carica TaxID=3494 RepID=A0AA88AMU1_FICCA|nr:hypothetical protein TIFTF001_012111 [Ficus carica]